MRPALGKTEPQSCLGLCPSSPLDVAYASLLGLPVSLPDDGLSSASAFDQQAKIGVHAGPLAKSAALHQNRVASALRSNQIRLKPVFDTQPFILAMLTACLTNTFAVVRHGIQASSIGASACSMECSTQGQACPTANTPAQHRGGKDATHEGLGWNSGLPTSGTRKYRLTHKYARDSTILYPHRAR